jgi:hypothetical protein
VIVFCFSLQEEDIIEHNNGIVTCLQWSMPKHDVLELTNAKCHLPML